MALVTGCLVPYAESVVPLSGLAVLLHVLTPQSPDALLLLADAAMLARMSETG